MKTDQSPKNETPAHLRLEESVSKVAMLLELLGDSLASQKENSKQRHKGILTWGMLTMVDDLKNNLINDWEASHREWQKLSEAQNN